MASAGRFVILLLFYALLCINHWWVIAVSIYFQPFIVNTRSNYFSTSSAQQISTAGSCGFLIVKVFFYEVGVIAGLFVLQMLICHRFYFSLLQWAKATNYTLDVFLVLSSFVLSWGEAWFLDFRVLPQESLARDFFRGLVFSILSFETKLRNKL